MGRNLSLVWRKLANLDSAAENRRLIAIKALKTYVKDLNSQFLAQDHSPNLVLQSAGSFPLQQACSKVFSGIQVSCNFEYGGRPVSRKLWRDENNGGVDVYSSYSEAGSGSNGSRQYFEGEVSDIFSEVFSGFRHAVSRDRRRPSTTPSPQLSYHAIKIYRRKLYLDGNGLSGHLEHDLTTEKPCSYGHMIQETLLSKDGSSSTESGSQMFNPGYISLKYPSLKNDEDDHCHTTFLSQELQQSKKVLSVIKDQSYKCYILQGSGYNENSGSERPTTMPHLLHPAYYPRVVALNPQSRRELVDTDVGTEKETWILIYRSVRYNTRRIDDAEIFDGKESTREKQSCIYNPDIFPEFDEEIEWEVPELPAPEPEPEQEPEQEPAPAPEPEPAPAPAPAPAFPFVIEIQVPYDVPPAPPPSPAPPPAADDDEVGLDDDEVGLDDDEVASDDDEEVGSDDDDIASDDDEEVGSDEEVVSGEEGAWYYPPKKRLKKNGD